MVFYCSIQRNLYICRSQIFCKYLSANRREETFSAIYKFPYIRPTSLINRLKTYQTSLTLLSIPGSFALYNFNIVSHDIFLHTSVLGVTGTVTLFLFGMFADRLIGYIYVNEDCTDVKISYADFWGRRKDVIIPVKDIVPLTELPVKPTDVLYLTLKRYSCNEIFKINLKYGIIQDKNKFTTVFLQ